MLTDLFDLRIMLERACIEYTIDPDAKYPLTERSDEQERFIQLTVEKGYIGFQTIFEFNSDGRPLTMGAYE